MRSEYTMNVFLTKNKEDFTAEEFVKKFIRNLTIYNRGYEEKLEDMLLALYQMPKDLYLKWYKSFTKIPYVFVKTNSELCTDIVLDNKLDLLPVAYDMFKKEKSIVSRIIGTKATKTTVHESKEKILFELEKALLSMKSENEDNVLEKAKKDFTDTFKPYANNKYVKDYYDSIIDGFENEIITAINYEFNRVEAIDYRLAVAAHAEVRKMDISFNAKNHTKGMAFKRTFK